MIDAFTTSTLASGACYIMTTSASYLCTRPTVERRVAGIFNKIRHVLADVKDFTVNMLGHHFSAFLSDVVINNMWISVFAITMIFCNLPGVVDAETILLVTVGSIYIAAAGWMLRITIATFLPEAASIIAGWIAPNNFDRPQRGRDVIPIYINIGGQNQPAQPVANDINPFQLRALPAIPEELHEDPVFRKYICTITMLPTRHPVGDPNGRALYDRSAIERWIREHHNSPITRHPLTRDQLVPKPRIQAFIDDRLLQHETALKASATPLLQLPVNAQLLAAATQENA